MTIITTIDEVKQYVEVAKTLNFLTIKPSLTTVQGRILKKHLGEPLYKRLCDAYAAADNKVSGMEANLIELTTLCQSAVTNIATSILLSRLSINVSESGVGRLETATLKTAFQYQEVNAKESYKSAGFDALEDAISYLEANKSEFPEWVNSPAYIDYTRFFIRSADQFSEQYNIQQSRLSFMAVRYIMKRVEDFQIRAVTGVQLFNKLKYELKIDSLTEQNKMILNDYIIPATALLTIATGVWERAVDISEHGVTVALRGGSENNELRQPASFSRQQKLADQLTAAGNDYLSKLGTELFENADLYPDFATPAGESKRFQIKNRPDNGIFGV